MKAVFINHISEVNPHIRLPALPSQRLLLANYSTLYSKDRLGLFFGQESRYLPEEYINADDVIAFCIYLMNKMRGNLIEIRSCATFRWFYRFDRFSSYFQVEECLG